MDNLCLSISKKWIQIRAGQLVFEVTVKNGYEIELNVHIFITFPQLISCFH